MRPETNAGRIRGQGSIQPQRLMPARTAGLMRQYGVRVGSLMPMSRFAAGVRAADDAAHEEARPVVVGPDDLDPRPDRAGRTAAGVFGATDGRPQPLEPVGVGVVAEHDAAGQEATQGALVLSVLGEPGRAVEHLHRPQDGERAPGGTGLPREAVEGCRVSVLRRSPGHGAPVGPEVEGCDSAHDSGLPPGNGPTARIGRRGSGGRDGDPGLVSSADLASPAPLLRTTFRNRRSAVIHDREVTGDALHTMLRTRVTEAGMDPGPYAAFIPCGPDM